MVPGQTSPNSNTPNADRRGHMEPLSDGTPTPGTHAQAPAQAQAQAQAAGPGGFPEHWAHCPAWLMRCEADGELSPSLRDRLETVREKFPDMQSRVGYERALRGACGRVMGEADVRVPASLRGRVADLVRSAGSADVSAVAAPVAADDALADRLAARAAETRGRGFWQSQAGRALGALAAVLVLGLGGVYVAQIAGGLGGLGGPAVAASEREHRVELAQFVAREHAAVATDAAFADRKAVARDLASAASLCSALAGAEPSLPTEAASCPLGKIVFVGAGQCHVPGKGGSSHMQYRLVGPAGETAPISLFVKENDGLLSLTPGRTYTLPTPPAAAEWAEVQALFVWSDENLVYVLVVPRALPAGEGGGSIGVNADAVLRAFGREGELDSL